MIVLGMTMVVLAVAGLAIDGTRAFLVRRTLQSAADAAALAGAGEIDRVNYYVSSGRRIRLDPHAARRAAARWLALRALQTDASVDASIDTVVVTLRGRVRTQFLRLIGIEEIPVAVEAASSPVSVP